MSDRNFMQLLQARWDEGKFVCIGLDSDAGKFPILQLGLNYHSNDLSKAQAKFQLAQRAKPGTRNFKLTQRQRTILADAQLAFNKQIVDATHDLVCAYKLNSAFYEALGSKGIRALELTIDYIHQVAPDVVVILDFKRADTSNSNIGYVMAIAGADAITVNPYFGVDALGPFLKLKDKGIIIVCKTSNPGGGELQDLKVESEGGYPAESLYQRVARLVAREWNYNGNCALVVGATYPEDAAKIRYIVGESMPLLLPGYGAQGGCPDGVKAGANKAGQGVMVSNSREMIFGDDRPNFVSTVRHNAALCSYDISKALKPEEHLL
jgi:orotidine-5'-phosphate decarboxylase